ncbi:MAG: PfkB family carbohydrate kinase [Anaerolineales bacterium]
MHAPVSYLTIGHVAKDVVSGGHRLGGSVAYAALTAQAMGYAPGIVTAHADDLDASAIAALNVHRTASSVTTTFENLYGPEGRTQYLRARAALLAPADVPTEWLLSPILHLAPLDGELDVAAFTTFSNRFIGLTAQGMLRGWASDGRVFKTGWPGAASVLPHLSAAVLSIEDVNGDWVLVERWAKAANVLAVTEGQRGCMVFVKGSGARQFDTAPQIELDPTGAGDIFAAAFFIHLYETQDAWAAARVANHIASISVTRTGLAGIPTLEEVGVARLKAELN